MTNCNTNYVTVAYHYTGKEKLNAELVCESILDIVCDINDAIVVLNIAQDFAIGLNIVNDQGGIIKRILASRMQQNIEPRAKFSAKLMQSYANSAKLMCQTRYFERSICSKGLGCGEVKYFIQHWS